MRSLRALILLSSVLIPSAVSAQTSGTLTSQTAQNWTTAPWNITAGAGTFPDAGGVAIWNTHTNTTIGTVAGNATVTLDAPITLSSIGYNSPFSMGLAGSAINTLNLSASGGALNAQLTIANTPTLFQLANNITAPIAGGGAVGLTKSGSGTITLGNTTAANTYTGGTHINGGILVISTNATVGDGILGATGAGNGISLSAGELFNNVTGGWTTARDISLGAGGGRIYTNTAATINGVISGAGTFNYYGFAAAGVMTLTNTNTYTGATVTSSSAVSTLTLSGNGSIASSSSYDFAGVVNLNSSATNVSNRLNDTAPIAMRGAQLTLTGNAGAATNETVGAITLANGVSIITVTPNAAQAASINAASFTRQNNSTLFVRGTSLGNAAGANVAQVTSTAAPTLVGGGGAGGSTNISIVPWAVGNTSATASLGSSFVTHGATGFRPLATTEYAAAFGSATDNVRLTAATVAAAGDTANALLFAPAAAATLSGGPINITSGAFLYSPTTAVTGTVSAGLNFGTAEGIISTSNTLGVSGVISGSGGLTVNAIAGSTVTITGASTYTGPTTLLGGQLSYTGNITADSTPSPLGAGTSATSPIVLNAGTATTRLWATAAATFDRDLIVRAGGPGLAGFGTTGNFVVTMNGNITLERRLSLEGGGTAASAMVINGNISGAGSLTDAFSAFTQLNGNNTYSGGTNILTGTYLAGSNTAFGTGTIFFSNLGFIQSSDATARTLANNVFLANNPTFQGTGALTFTGGLNLNGARTLAISNTAAAGVTFSGVVSNGALTKTGTGVLSLSSPTGNTYTGGTVLAASAGTLNVNNTTGSGTGTGTVSIGGTTAADRSTLSGNFTISGATSIAGALTPGNGGVGTANFGSSLTYTANGLTTLELASAGSADKVNVVGLLTLGGSTIAVVTTGGFQAAAGNTFDLADWGTVAGTATLDLSGATLADPVGTFWDTSAFPTTGVITVVPIPEPSMVLLLGGLGMFGARTLRRRFRGTDTADREPGSRV